MGKKIKTEVRVQVQPIFTLTFYTLSLTTLMTTADKDPADLWRRGENMSLF